jgi:uncharacterized membrane protein
MALNFFLGINTIIYAIILSILPIAELRGGIPVAVAGGSSLLTAFIVCSIANILVVPIAFVFLETFHKLFIGMKWYANLFDKFVHKTRQKITEPVEKYGYLGLLIFVAIPLPMTGAWTATLGAWLLGMNKTKSFIAIAAGVVAAGVIVTLAVAGFIGGAGVLYKTT